MNKQWYEISVNFSTGNRMYVCRFEKNLQQSVLSKGEDKFIKLLNIRWLKQSKNKKPKIVKLENYKKGENSNAIYVKKSIIDSIFPLRKDSVFYKK